MSGFTHKQHPVLRIVPLLLLIGVFGVSCDASDSPSAAGSAEQTEVQQAEVDPVVDSLARSTADLPAMLEQRIIRVLVSYSQTNFFRVGGDKKGLEYELMRKFEEYINTNVKKGKLDINFVFIAVPFAQLIPKLIAGEGDIIAAGMTITPEREAKIAFSRPYIKNVNEIVVSSQGQYKLTSADALSGKNVIVTNGSSYIDHLEQLNGALRDKDKDPVDIKIAHQHLVTEDLLQMVNAGIYSYTIADSHIAELWTAALPEIELNPKAAINTGGKIAWGVRKDNPQLLAVLNKFARKHQQGTLLGNILIKRYYENTKWVDNPLTDRRKAQLAKYYDLFREYGAKYNFDWHLLAALAFQESRLDQNARSSAGAVGVMQIKPSTAADRNVGITNIKDSVENNIHAGTKYLAFLRDRYFSDDSLDPLDQFAFTAAAYNAGPAKVRRLRNSAARKDLNPDQWFDNVEHIARQRIGTETVTYVSNIYKYFVSYKSIERTQIERARAIQQAR